VFLCYEGTSIKTRIETLDNFFHNTCAPVL